MGKSILTTGAAAVGVGALLGTMGAIGVAAMMDLARSAMAYNKEASLTLTQVDRVGVGLETVKRIGRDVAAAIPAPFDQMQAALFDIFSSIRVGASGAQRLLTSFSKAAVAGQTEIISASRATIGMMNAFQIPIRNVNDVLDVQFQLVRKGILTYDELVSNIGKAIPAFAAAGQEITTMAGALAFMTRQGVSVAMSTTSIARAMELIARPDSVRNLEALGVQVRTSSGEFRQLNEIITDMATGPFKDLTGPEFREMFTQIFGQGTIQARRFFDLAIPNYKSLNRLTGEMVDSSGAMQAAYDIMFADPAVQAQLLRNNIEVLKTELGDELLPVIQRLLQGGLGLIRWFREMPEPIKKAMVLFTAGASALSLFLGVVIAIAGAIGILVGGLTMLGVPLGMAVGAFTGIGIALAAFVAAIYLVSRNWDTLVGVFRAAPEVFILLASVITAVLVGGAIMKLISSLAMLVLSLATTSAVGAGTTAVMGTLGLAMSAAAPYIAVAAALAVGLAAAWMLTRASAEEAKVANEELTQAMRDQNNVVGENSSQWAASFLTDAGLIDDLRAAELSVSDVEEALMGTGDTVQNLLRQMSTDSSGAVDWEKYHRLASVLQEMSGEYQLAADAFETERLANALAFTGSEAATAAGNINTLFGSAEEAQAWEDAIVASIEGATDPVSAMGDEWENAFVTWRDNMNLMLTATANWQRNLLTLAEGGRLGLMEAVAAQGVELAPVLQDAINRGEGALDEMEDIFATRGTQMGEGFTINFADAMDLVSTFRAQGQLTLQDFARFGVDTVDGARALVQDVNSRLASMGSDTRIRLGGLDVDTQPVYENVSAALQWIQSYKETRAEARLLADGSPARAEMDRLLTGIRQSWVATVFGTEVDADTRPARRAFNEALRMGRNFDASRWAALLDANNDPAMNAIAAARRAGERFAAMNYEAQLTFVTVGAGAADAAHGRNRAAGGPVRMNELYVVGERGPELFVPGMSGTIIPNHTTSGTALGGGESISVSPTYNISGTNIQGPELMRILRKHDKELVDIIRKKSRSGK